MPKRILDDTFLDSRSMEVLSPSCQDAFPRFILLADDFGCFEVNPVILRARGWSRRPDVDEATVEGWLTEMAERQAVDPETGTKLAPVLMVWTHVGRRYAHLTGWFGPHGQKKRAEYDPNAPAGTPGRHGSKRKTPPPPGDLLAAVLAGNVRAVDGKPPGTDRDAAGNASDGIPSDSTPARAGAGKSPGTNRDAAGKCTVPGPAVPVAVPVAAAVGTAAAAAAAEGVNVDPPAVSLRVVEGPEPTAEATRAAHPLVAAFRLALADRLAVPADWLRVASAERVAVTRDDLERELARVGIPAAVEACFEAAVREQQAGRRKPQHLAWYLRIVADLTPAGSPPPATPRRQVVVGFDDAGSPILGESAR